MCLVGNVAFANVFYIRVVMLTSWNVLSQLRNACFTDTPLSLGTQRSRQVKLINVPLKVLCPLFMTKVVEVGSTFRARVAKAMLEKQDYFIIFFFYFILLAFFTSCQ